MGRSPTKCAKPKSSKKKERSEFFRTTTPRCAPVQSVHNAKQNPDPETHAGAPRRHSGNRPAAKGRARALPVSARPCQKHHVAAHAAEQHQLCILAVDPQPQRRARAQQNRQNRRQPRAQAEPRTLPALHIFDSLVFFFFFSKKRRLGECFSPDLRFLFF